jgi:hypothetical protein
MGLDVSSHAREPGDRHRIRRHRCGGRPGGYAGAAALTAGVFVGSALWWLILTISVGVFRGKLNDRGLQWVGSIRGGAIVGCGLFALLGGVLRAL